MKTSENETYNQLETRSAEIEIEFDRLRGEAPSASEIALATLAAQSVRKLRGKIDEIAGTLRRRL